MIRKAKSEDIRKCVEIEYAAWEEDRKVIKKDLNRQVNDTDYYFFVMEKNSEVVGFVTARKHEWNKSTYLERLYVSEEERSKGHGTSLLDRIISESRKMKVRIIFVDTGEKCHRGIRFYKKNGFKKAGYIKNFYNDPKDRNGIVFSYNLG